MLHFIEGGWAITTPLQPDYVYFFSDFLYGQERRRKRIPKPERGSQVPVKPASVIRGNPNVEALGVADPPREVSEPARGIILEASRVWFRFETQEKTTQDSSRR